MNELWKAIKPYLLVAPQTLVFLLFLVFPLLTILIVSFWPFDGLFLTPGFTLGNYREIFSSSAYLTAFLNTFKFAFSVWFLTLILAFPVAYFLAFYVHSLRNQVILFLLCTIPFWTSNIIRMISWIPFLGREGLLNSLLLSLHLIQEPVNVFLFSDFSVILAMVHLYVLFMLVPIFNSMMRIDRAVISAAADAGASGLTIVREVIIPLSAPGIAIGSIFVVTLVMGEYVTTRLMSGGKASSVAYLMKNLLDSLQYPTASALAVLLLVGTMGTVALILRFVNIRKEL